MPLRRVDPAPARCPVVPGYVLEERLGRGGSGEVWRARPRSGGDPVAVKVLHGDADRQNREAALLAELDHPHLVRLHEVVRRETPQGTQVALVLELLAGGSLAALLAGRGRLRPGEVVTALAPVGAALAHLHERGIVHGDLSPGNIVFTAEGRPVLTDLGVARVLGDAATGEVTPPYVDPVVARGGAAGPASDVFGVAAAAFHALTGIPPWNAAGPTDTLQVAAAGLVPELALLAPGAPPDLLAVIERGMSPHPHLRGSATAFALDLRHACHPERIALPAAGSDALLARTGQGPRTELTHQVRRPPRAHAAPVPASRWRRFGGGTVGGAVGGAWRRLRDRVRDGSASGPGGPWRLLRRMAAVPVAAAALLAAVWVGVQWGGAAQEAGSAVAASTAVPVGPTGVSGPTSASAVPDAGPAVPEASGPVPSADTTSVPADPEAWADLIAELYERRAAVFTGGGADELTGVYTPTSDLLRADADRVDQLVAAGQRLEGFAPEVVAVAAATPVEGGVLVQLTDRVPAYAVVGPAGEQQEVAGRGGRPVAMTVVATAQGWRIASAELMP